MEFSGLLLVFKRSLASFAAWEVLYIYFGRTLALVCGS